MSNLEIKFPTWMQEFFRPHRYKVLYGGRGSGKSYAVADYLLLAAAQRPMRILCAREYQNSLSESVIHLLAERAKALYLDRFFIVQRDSIRGKNYSQFIFRGVRNNIASIKSLAKIDCVWVEEAQTLSKVSWDILIPTIREPGSEFLVTFNPVNNDDPTYKMFVTDPPKDAYVRKVNWRDNPHWPDILEMERVSLLEKDPELYQHVYEGECLTISDAQIFKHKYEVREVRFTQLIANKADGPYVGLDFGFSVDPTAWVSCWILNNTLYIDKCGGGHGIELDLIPVKVKECYYRYPNFQNLIIRADSARPDSISYLKRYGLPGIEPSSKGKNSVRDGIEFLRSFNKIVIDPSCTSVIREFSLYRYKTDRLSGDIRPDPEDTNNHWIDALRYALEPVMKKSRFNYSGLTGL